MAIEPFVWKGNQAVSAADVANYRKLADSLNAARTGRTPTNPWEGLNALAQAWTERQWRDKASEAEQAGRSSLTDALQNGDYQSILGSEWATPQQSALASALMQRNWRKADLADERAYDAPLRDVQLHGGELGNDLTQMKIDSMKNPPPDRNFMNVNGNVVMTDSTSGTMQDLGHVGGIYRPLTPEERAGYNIPASAAARMGPDGKPEILGGSQTTVNVAPGEKAWDQESAKLFAKQYSDLTNQAASAQDMLGLYDAAQQALDSGVYTGPGGEPVLELQRLGNVLGIDNTNKVAGGELVRAIQNRMALIMRSPDSGMGMPGAVSDRDLKFLKDAQIGLNRSPEGNRKMLKAFSALENRKVEIAGLADQYIADHGRLDSGFNQTVRQYAKQHPMFEGLFEPPTTPGDNQPPATFTGDPGLWQYMTPEDRALWQN